MTVYHDSAYGRATQPALELLAKKYGFENIQIPVADPGNEQSPQWRRVREIKPDWVFLRTWGVSTVVALKTAQRFGFPADHIIGDVWAGSESDVIPAGDAAKGYRALAPYPGGTGFEIHKRLKQHILDKGKSDLRDTGTSVRSTTTSARSMPHWRWKRCAPGTRSSARARSMARRAAGPGSISR